MKIEFCCEELYQDALHGLLEMSWRYGADDERELYLIPIADRTDNDCPHCDAKIEITVRDDKS